MDISPRELTPDEINTVAMFLETVTKDQKPGCLCGAGNWQVLHTAVYIPMWTPEIATVPIHPPLVLAVMVYCGTCGEFRQINPFAIPIDLIGEDPAGRADKADNVEKENAS